MVPRKSINFEFVQLYLFGRRVMIPKLFTWQSLNSKPLPLHSLCLHDWPDMCAECRASPTTSWRGSLVTAKEQLPHLRCWAGRALPFTCDGVCSDWRSHCCYSVSRGSQPRSCPSSFSNNLSVIAHTAPKTGSPKPFSLRCPSRGAWEPPSLYLPPGFLTRLEELIRPPRKICASKRACKGEEEFLKRQLYTKYIFPIV